MMFQKSWHWLALLVTLGVLGVGWIVYSRVPAASETTSPRVAPRTGFNAPSFQTVTPSGEPIKLDTLRGSVVVLNFWATWCGPCRAEMPALQSVYERRKADGLVVLGIDQLEDRDTVNDFLRELRIQFLIGLDESGAMSKLYRVRALPTTFFVDRHGVIRDIVYSGPMDTALLESKISSLLDEP